MNQKCCTTCPHVDINEISDEKYCRLKDYKPIHLRWYKHRPEWCPRLAKNRGAKDEQAYLRMNPPNGWGSTKSALKTLESLRKCIDEIEDPDSWTERNTVPKALMHVAW